MKMHRQYNFYFILFSMMCVEYEYQEPYTSLTRVDSVVFNHHWLKGLKLQHILVFQ